MVDQKDKKVSKEGVICSCNNSPPLTTSHNSMTYVVLGPPAPWSRAAPNYIRRSIYDTQKNLKLLVGIELASQHGERPLFDGPLHIDWCFYLEIPTRYKSKRASMIGKPHYVKPDISNLIKFYEDVSNKIIFKDDSTIATGTWKKVYDEHPRTEFTIRKIIS